jgi:NADH:ubiquinone oxidoreductase subunit
MTSLIDRLAQIFTWWNRQTLNTQFYTWRFGEKVGEDEFGNIYYRKPGPDPALGFERRWVIYAGVAEGSMTPPGWYGWLHHTVDVAPPDVTYKPREWEMPHLPNMTGTPQAWRPPGSTLREGERPLATGDYEAWTPN